MRRRIGEINRISKWKTVRQGKAKGILVGGNLSCILKLAGTRFFPQMKNKILLLECYKTDIPTSVYRITQLRQMGIFKKISAVVVGYVWGFQHEKNRIAQFEDLLLDITEDYKFPILKINEFGHKCPNTL